VSAAGEAKSRQGPSPRERTCGRRGSERAAGPCKEAVVIASSQRGIALIMVLWLTVMLTVIGGAFAFSMRGEALAARNAVSIAQVRAAADGAVDRTVLELMRPRTKESWKADGQYHRWKDGSMLLVVSAVDESARIDLNTAAEPLLKNLFVVLGEIDDAAASAVVDAIVDWRDADEMRRPNGAEAADYRAANSNYVPSNRDFESVGELARVLGVTPAIYAKVAPALTVHSRQRGINSLTASRTVLLAVPGATPQAVDAFVTARDEALANNLPVQPFPPAAAFGAGAGAVWRVRAEAFGDDGVTFVREAVVRATADPRRPYYALLWSEGERPAPPPPAAPEAASTSRVPANDASRS
jgi:general secretion pathway protein K